MLLIVDVTVTIALLSLVMETLDEFKADPFFDLFVFLLLPSKN